jgi:hypothetical protein
VLSAFESAELTVAEDELMGIRNDGRLKLNHSSADVASFCLSLRQGYPIMTKKAIQALRPFSTSSLCKAGSSAMNTTKSKNRSLLQTLEDLRVCLSTIRPRKRDITRKGFPTDILWLHEDFLFLLMFVFKEDSYMYCK